MKTIRTMNHFVSRCAWALSISVFASLVGCGQAGPDYGSLDLSSAGGTVTLGGQPLANALVLFEADDLTYSYALTDDSGRYKLMFNSEKAGVTKGSKTVRIWSSRGIPGMAEAGGSVEEEDPDAKRKKAEKVPAKYNEKSELTVMVTDSSKKFDFDL